ncbi:hypothetical protein QRD89_10320 [Halobacillus sp. ACCC02827]|uniref:hypothetical protein n=1 Tax=unclassified Halobacillus TaxID=2636472 RepID=UPI000785E794|nr:MULTISPECIES: hypothetical protein [unclassified Halobacillus]WJE14123.1 hypothetical protein QRD89_10320 [Halobacillus sp. ACCC02827]
MSDKLKEKDQAEQLRSYAEKEQFQETEPDVLNLPPRRDTHDSKQSKTKWKVGTLWIRFLLLVFIILICVWLSYPYWDQWFEHSILDPSQPEYQHQKVTVDRTP